MVVLLHRLLACTVLGSSCLSACHDEVLKASSAANAATAATLTRAPDTAEVERLRAALASVRERALVVQEADAAAVDVLVDVAAASGGGGAVTPPRPLPAYTPGTAMSASLSTPRVRAATAFSREIEESVSKLRSTLRRAAGDVE